MQPSSKPCVLFHYRCNVAGRNAGYNVQGSANQPSINGHYSRSNQTENGFPVYTKQGLVLWWARHGTRGGQWSISDAIGSGFRATEPVNTSPSGTSGPSTSGWNTWHGNQWVLESTLHVMSGRKSCMAYRIAGFFTNGFSLVSMVSMVLWFNHGFLTLTPWFCLPRGTKTGT